MKYSEKLKDGRWQVKKTAIMTRDNFTCRICGRKATNGTTLNVHHLHYMRGLEPWEYEDSELITLCEDCHKRTHDKINEDFYDIHIGDMVSYDHSDYTNFGFVYDIDFGNMTAKIATVDDGGGYEQLYVEEISINKDGSLYRGFGRPVFKEKRVSYDWEEGFFYACVASNLAKVRRNYENHNYDDYEDLNGLGIERELEKMALNYDTILDNNPSMKDFIEGL